MEELGCFEQAQVSSRFLEGIGSELVIKRGLEEGYEDEPGIDDQGDFRWRWMIERIDAEVGFP